MKKNPYLKRSEQLSTQHVLNAQDNSNAARKEFYKIYPEKILSRPEIMEHIPTNLLETNILAVLKQFYEKKLPKTPFMVAFFPRENNPREIVGYNSREFFPTVPFRTIVYYYQQTWRLSNEYQLNFFLADEILYLIDNNGFSVEDAWKALCSDSSVIYKANKHKRLKWKGWNGSRIVFHYSSSDFHHVHWAKAGHPKLNLLAHTNWGNYMGDKHDDSQELFVLPCEE